MKAHAQKLVLPLLALALFAAAVFFAAWWLSRGATDSLPLNGANTRAGAQIDARSTSPEPSPSESRIPAGATPVDDAPNSGSPDDLVVRVLDAEGRPVRAARVVLCETASMPSTPFGVPDGSPTPATTDDDGRVRFAHPERALDFIIVLADSHVALGIARDVDRGEQTIVLARLTSITGLVRIDGGAPREPVTLTIEGFRDPSTAWSPAAAALWSKIGPGRGRMSTTTNADGSFAVAGLEAGEVVDLVTPATHWMMEDGTNRKRVTTPATGVLLDLQAAPRILGSCGYTPSADVSPPPHALHVVVHSTQTGISGRSQTRTLLLPLGSFEIPFVEPSIEAFELRIDDGARQLATVRRTGEFVGDVDVGWIELSSGSLRTTLRVEDERGAALAGARAWLSGRAFGPSNVDGEMLVSWNAGVSELLVGAFGYELLRTPMPVSASDPVVVRLHVANRLCVEVAPVDGDVLPRSLVLGVRIPRASAEDDPNRLPEFADIRGAPAVGGMFAADWHAHFFAVPATGVVERSDLPIDLPLDIRLQTRWKETLVEEQIVLRRGEVRRLRLLLPSLAGTVRGRVVDAAGAPIAGASIIAGTQLGPELTTDVDGRFVIDDVGSATLQLVVGAHGYATRSVSVHEIEAASAIVLERSRVVWVEVIGADGSRVEADVWAEIGNGETLRAVVAGPGLRVFDALPHSANAVLVKSEAGVQVVASIAPDQSRVSVRVER